ncbi:hypothetical protein HXX76_006433 [Chlamydomonas incerta]|uniref:EGF-like domain-containing protein n=1 Tax=Chlamydomonas incerta TaxID=51695 RepID=A0A835T145_CHLIN|nr:hypothetical protein HXX76_006433 [Chlamydomonas incerta]|eukprot:KAG2436914.1 hypothetical protein HXX76_006433 [Chlamydomonas incerta]
MCPWGYDGPACEVDRMAACRVSPSDPGSCSNLYTRNCECYRACAKLYCHDPAKADRCTHELGADMTRNRCWLRSDWQGGSTGAAGSELPEDWARGATTWYKHFAPQETRQSYDADPGLLEERSLWGSSNWRGNHSVHPPAACPGRCSGRGVCFRWEHEQYPRCMCAKGYNGTECATVDSSEACWFSPDCGGRGACKGGFCHCQPGFWGAGCHRGQGYVVRRSSPPVSATQPTVWPDLRSPTKLKIYMYDLPWDVAFPGAYNDGFFGRDPMYKAYELFLQYFLTDNVTRTENPWEANLFYVPLLLYFYIGNVRDAVPQTSWAINHIRSRWPFWDRSGGRDHFYFMTGDRGTCHLPRELQDQAIKVVHWGMQRAGIDWIGLDNKDYACIQLKRDLVVPPLNMFTEILPTDTVKLYQTVALNAGRDPSRTLLFFFAGGIAESMEYSGGTRQAIKQLLTSVHIANGNSTPADVVFVEGRTPDYRQLLLASKFCIAPYGFGWGLRLVQAMEFGCIPVIIQDHVYQAFEDFLPYEEFSVRLRLSEVPRLLDILRTYNPEQRAALRLGMAKYYRAFIWNREYGGEAYEWTLAGLQRRLANMQAGLYRRRRSRSRSRSLLSRHRGRRRADE